MTALIDILMATWNGAAHLSDQLDSIAAQTETRWHLTVRDDGSTDATCAILDRFAARHPGRVTVLDDGLGRLGPRGNFAHLMQAARAPYTAFADQDDVWRPDKLYRALTAMRGMEAQHGADLPLLVHADRRLISAGGAEITPSYWHSRGLRPARMRAQAHFTFCVAAGGTMLLNRPLRLRSMPVPEAARMYDCWIELVAHAFGHVTALDTIALDHRRHGANASGGAADIDSAPARRLGARAARLFKNLDRQRAIGRAYLAQAAAFRTRHGPMLSPAYAQRLDLLLNLSRASLPLRIAMLARSRAAPPGLARGLVFAALAGERGGQAPRPETAPRPT